MHWLLKISLRNYIYLWRIFLSPRAATFNSLRSVLVRVSRLSPSIWFSLNSSIQSPKPTWFSQSHTSLLVHSLTWLGRRTSFFYEMLTQIVRDSDFFLAWMLLLILLIKVKVPQRWDDRLALRWKVFVRSVILFILDLNVIFWEDFPAFIICIFTFFRGISHEFWEHW